MNHLNLNCKKKLFLASLLFSCSMSVFGQAPFEYHIENNYDFSDPYARLTKCNSSDKSIQIPKECTINGKTYEVREIGVGAFANKKSIESISLSSNLVSIFDRAFVGCVNLTKVDGSNATRLAGIGDEAFSNCNKLNSVSITSNNPLGINPKAFANCSALHHIDITSGIAAPGSGNFADLDIAANAFDNCANLTDAHFIVKKDDDTVDSRILCYSCFNNCPNLTFITLEADQLKYFENIVEGSNNVKQIYIPAQVIWLGSLFPGAAFKQCNSLTDIFLVGKKSGYEGTIRRIIKEDIKDQISLHYPKSWNIPSADLLPNPWCDFTNKVEYGNTLAQQKMISMDAYNRGINETSDLQATDTTNPDTTITVKFGDKTFTKSISPRKNIF